MYDAAYLGQRREGAHDTDLGWAFCTAHGHNGLVRACLWPGEYL